MAVCRTMRRMAIGLFLGLTVATQAPLDARAEPGCGCPWCERRPYGAPAPGRGRYGAASPVRSEAEARQRLEAYFDGRDLVVGKIVERPLYYEASVKHRDGRLVDRVIIDKRSGRIRSIL